MHDRITSEQLAASLNFGLPAKSFEVKILLETDVLDARTLSTALTTIYSSIQEKPWRIFMARLEALNWLITYVGLEGTKQFTSPPLASSCNFFIF